MTTTANDNFLLLFFYFSEKTSLEISCESSADSHEMSRLFSEKKKKKLECCLLQILLGALRVNQQLD